MVLDACLASLVRQCHEGHVPLIVARADHPSAIEGLAVAYPTVQVVAVPIGTDLPRLRGAGLAVATGDLVALTEDHCVADAGWVSSMRGYLGQPIDVVGGGMDNARRARATDWGAFFAEYGVYAGQASRTDAPDAPPLLITAANVGYARRVQTDVVEWTMNGTWENVVHDRLRSRGAVLVFDAGACVRQNLSHSLSSFIADRFRHGRQYARDRLAESPRAGRWLRIGTSILLPPLLAFRIARIAVGSSERAIAFVRALPFTIVFLIGWAAGEASGYWLGASAGPRLDRPE